MLLLPAQLALVVHQVVHQQPVAQIVDLQTTARTFASPQLSHFARPQLTVLCHPIAPMLRRPFQLCSIKLALLLTTDSTRTGKPAQYAPILERQLNIGPQWRVVSPCV